MVKVYVFILFLIIHAGARENPFSPSSGEQELPITSNKIQSLEKLKMVSAVLPSTARIIKKVTIEYENLDASIENKIIDLDNTIDWHLPIFISQSYTEESSVNKKEKISNENSKKIEEKFNKVASIEYASFSILGKSFKIMTKDNLIRHFLLAQPHRIVMDYRRTSSLEYFEKKFENSVFTKMRVGNHKNYYRVVIELDGFYRYKLEEQSDGCLITLE